MVELPGRGGLRELGDAPLRARPAETALGLPRGARVVLHRERRADDRPRRGTRAVGGAQGGRPRVHRTLQAAGEFVGFLFSAFSSF